MNLPFLAGPTDGLVGLTLRVIVLLSGAWAPATRNCRHHSPDSGTLQRAPRRPRERPNAISEGDCLFLYTGHGDVWHSSEWDSYNAAEKARRVAVVNAGKLGFGISACHYLAERKSILWGGDTWGTEAVGLGFGGETEQPFECHIKMMTRRGIWNIENLDFSQLLADKVSEFLFVWSPLKTKGATGSPGNPVALY